MKPGKYEFEIEAEIIHEFIKNGSRGHAYEPIIASGKNACILHYTNNNDLCKEEDVILFDFGCEYGNYNADLSRALPVSGKFTRRQRDVYQAVLNVQKEAIKMLRPGNSFKEYLFEVGKQMESELITLGLIDRHDVAKQDISAPLYKKYFMHGTSHHLGLDVHDYGSYVRPMQEGMVLTCEPGIYIREEGLGIRLENNILITNEGPQDLMRNIPIEVEEIEEIMNQ